MQFLALLFLLVHEPLLLGQSETPVPVRLIVLNSETEAQAVFARLRKGDDFAVVAREKSVDATSADGGFLGSVNPATLRIELRQAIASLKPGQISNLFRLGQNYAVVKLLTASEVADKEALEQERQMALRAETTLRFAPDVAGIIEAENVFRKYPKPADWQQDLHSACETRTKSFTSALQQVEQFMDPANEPTLINTMHLKPLDLVNSHVGLGQFYAYEGDMAKAVEQWELAYKMASQQVPQAIPQLEETLGIGYLHKSEMENEVYRAPGDRCLFPMPPGVHYEKPADSEKAVQHFLNYLAGRPDSLEVRWLLNLAYATLGQYPNGVPQKYLIPLSSFTSNEKVGRFVDVAPQAKLDLFGMAGGVIVDDFDNDGLFDVVTSSFDNCHSLRFLHNNGDGTFSERTEQAGLSGQLGGLNILQTDYNNDGCPDILVLRGGWELPERKSLLRNNCNGTFTDVTASSGLAEPATSTQTAVWADINNDGLLDLFVGNEDAPAQLFLNNGDGTFKDISHSAGVDSMAFAKGVVAADYDGDGYVDLYLSNFNGLNLLFRNNHDQTFTEIASQAGVQGTGKSFATWFFDYDNDGWPDLFVTSYYMSVEESMRTYLGLPHEAGTLKLYKNLGNGAFRDVTKQTKLDLLFMPMGSNFGDIDNDGYPDIYLGTGNPSYGSELPNVLLLNKEGKSFVDVTESSGTGELHKGHGVSFADIDFDGDEDLLTQIGGAEPGDAHVFRLFENPGNGNDWISVRLVGVKANRSAIGARIKVTVRNDGRSVRSVYRTVSSGGSFGASPLEQHIGLGHRAEILRIEILWPDGSVTPQSFTNVAANQAIEIRQFSRQYSRLERRPYRLGGAPRETSNRLRKAAVPETTSTVSR
jgi:tetratricopeptide (TPR) repeat protein